MKGYGKISYTNKDMADKLHTSIKTIERTKKSLTDKGVLTKINNSPITITDFYNLDKVGQAIIWKLKEHDEKLKEQIKINKEQNKINEILVSNAQQQNQRLDNLENLMKRFLETQEKLAVANNNTIIL